MNRTIHIDSEEKLIEYFGRSDFDSGIFYSPYIPLQITKSLGMVRVVVPKEVYKSEMEEYLYRLGI